MSAKVGSSSVTPTPASAVLGASGPAQQPPNISVLQKKDAAGKFIPNTVDGAMVRIRLFDDRERVLFFKVSADDVMASSCSSGGSCVYP